MDLKVILLQLSILLCTSNAVGNLDILSQIRKVALNQTEVLDKPDPFKKLQPVFALKKIFSENVSNEQTTSDDQFLRNIVNNDLMLITEKHALDWTHEEQHDWHKKYPACGGVNQSPIDLIKREADVVSYGDCLRWSNYEDNKRLILNNNGHTIEAKSAFENLTLPTLEGGPLNGVYNFANMHWHWGKYDREGSEHTFNSKSYPIELHIIHYKSKFASLTEAVASGEGDALAVVGILFELSNYPTPGMTSLTRSMLKAKEQGMQRGNLPLNQLGLGFSDGFYSYQGSLTTPPCYPIVRWIVMMKPLPITKHDLKIFRAVKVDGHPLVDNYRKVQPINDRKAHVYNSCKLHH